MSKYAFLQLDKMGLWYGLKHWSMQPLSYTLFFVHILAGTFSHSASYISVSGHTLSNCTSEVISTGWWGGHCTRSGPLSSCISQHCPIRLFTLKHDNRSSCKPQSHGDIPSSIRCWYPSLMVSHVAQGLFQTFWSENPDRWILIF